MPRQARRSKHPAWAERPFFSARKDQCMKYHVTATRILCYEGEMEADTLEDAMESVASLPHAQFEQVEDIVNLEVVEESSERSHP